MNRRSLLASAAGLLGLKVAPKPSIPMPTTVSYTLLRKAFESRFYNACLHAPITVHARSWQTEVNLDAFVGDIWEDCHADAYHKLNGHKTIG